MHDLTENRDPNRSGTRQGVPGSGEENPREPASPPVRRPAEIPEDGAGGRDETAPAPLFGKGALLALLAWGLTILAVTAGIAGETLLWPLVPILGVAVPVLLIVLGDRGRKRAIRGRTAREALVSDDRAEREVLGALGDAHELTPIGVATRTSLTVSRASEVLGRLTAEGHLEVMARQGSLIYSLPSGDRRRLEAEPRDPANPAPRPEGPDRRPEGGAEPLEEPLSGREREVLALLASGKTNREVAQELYVAEGTVKAHAASIYRKLGVRNRAEMLNRARALGLLG